MAWLGGVLASALHLAVLLFLILLGVLLLVVIIKAILLLIPAALVALVVWFLTKNTTLAAIAFLVMAVLAALKHL